MVFFQIKSYIVDIFLENSDVSTSLLKFIWYIIFYNIPSQNAINSAFFLNEPMSLPLSFKTCCRKSSVKPTLSSMNLIPFSEPLYWKVNPLSQFVISRTSIPASFSMFICNTDRNMSQTISLSLSLSEQAFINLYVYI